jgi:hypothetical protein
MVTRARIAASVRAAIDTAVRRGRRWIRCRALTAPRDATLTRGADVVYSVFSYPVEGCLDVEAIARFLARQQDVLLDPLGTGIYLVCGLPVAVEWYRDRRLADPSEFPYVVLVTAKPEWVNVFQEYGDEDRLRSARDIVRWIIEHNRCRIEDEYRADWTDKVARDGVGVLYPEQLV